MGTHSQTSKMLQLLPLAGLMAALSQGIPIQSPECCDSKDVGGVSYSLVGQMDTTAYQCLNNCVYVKDQDPTVKFCFASGDLQVECTEDEFQGSDKPPMGGSDKPPMGGSDKPPMAGSEEPPMEGTDKPPMGETEAPAGSSGYTQAWLRGVGPYGHVHEGVRLEAGDGWVGVGDAFEEENTEDKKTQVMVRRVDNEGA